MDESFLHYEILEKLGEGGMGIVYLAQDTRLNRKVALKFLPERISRNPVDRTRFQREARAAAGLNHPNITQVYAFEEKEGEYCIVMEYVEGRELQMLVGENALSRREKSDIAGMMARGLKAAHDHGIVHRDIKSHNIMIDREKRVRIMDFGLARVSGSSHLTKTGATLGTVAYMSPEQLNGKEADEQSDIWSFGVVLYELYTGELPFRGKYEQAVMYSIMNEQPVPVSERDPGISPAMERLIHRCLAKEPGERYSDMVELLADLDTAESAAGSGGRGILPALTTRSSLLYIGIPVVLMIILLVFILPANVEWLKGGIPEQKYIAVLPIENLDDNPRLQPISEGLAETFSYRLSELERFEDSYWIAPASEMRKEQISSVTQAFQKFGVTLAIISSIQTVEDSTRLTLELVDAEDMRRLEASRVVVHHTDLAALERNSVRAMLDMLQIEMHPELEQELYEGPSDAPGAYEYYLRGRASLHSYITQDSLNHATQMFNRAIDLDPEFALGYAGLGEAYWIRYEGTRNREFLERADSVLNRALELNAGLAPVQELLGTLSREKGEYEQAIRHFNRALAIDPNHSSSYRGLAGVYEEQGKMEMAVETYRKAIAEKPDSWEGYRDLGRYHVNNGNFPAAVEQFSRVVELTPHNSMAFSNLGVAYHYNGEIERARDMYIKALALGNNPSAANNLGGIYYSEGEYEEAANLYEIAVKAYSNRYDVWGNLAAAHEWSGNEAKARENYLMAIEKAHEELEVNPENVSVLASLGAYYSDIDDTTRALDYIEKAIDRNAGMVHVRHRAVAVYEQLGMREEALKWIDSTMVSQIEALPEYRELVKDPRYRDLKEKWSAD